MKKEDNLKKIIHVVYINDFFPELFKITFPTVKKYAENNGYEINLITERKFPEWHIHYEKMQVYEAGKDADINILLDADILIHPNYPDVKNIIPPSRVAFNEAYNISAKCRLNKYFVRDGRDVGIASNFVMSSYLTHDLWKPLSITPEEGKKITLVREGDIDEYCLSHNLAKYGLKYSGLTWHEWMRNYVIHTGTSDRQNAIDLAQNTVNLWNSSNLNHRWKNANTGEYV